MCIVRGREPNGDGRRPTETSCEGRASRPCVTQACLRSGTFPPQVSARPSTGPAHLLVTTKGNAPASEAQPLLPSVAGRSVVAARERLAPGESMAKVVAAMTVAFLLPIAVLAEAGAPLDTVQSAVASVIKIVGRPDLQGTANLVARRALLRSVTDDFFDFPEMAQRSLGYHRATPSERERAEFVALFRELLERSYMTTIENYAGETIVYLGETVERDHATVRSRIVTRKRAEISVDYRLYRSAGGWATVDVVLENVSLVANYRQQFDRVIRTTSFATLLDRMRGGELAAFTVPPWGGVGKP